MSINCICGEVLSSIEAQKCYSSGAVRCNKCATRVTRYNKIYHCMKEKDSKYHPNGFDLCGKCSCKPLEKGDYIKITRPIKNYQTTRRYSDKLVDCYVIPNRIPFELINLTINNPKIFTDLYTVVINDSSTTLFSFNDCGENDCELFESDMKTMKAYTAAPKYKNVFTGKIQTIDTFPFVLAEKRGINDKKFVNCILESTTHQMFKESMNKYQLTNVDIINDNRNAKFIKRGNNAFINDIIDPNKNLGSLFVDAAIDKLNYMNFIPTVFMVNEYNQCKYLSQIPNVNPYSVTGKLIYKQISTLFGNMIEMFEHIYQDYSLRDVPLQVIVKAQDYNIENSNGFYEGNSHKDGVFENIVCVGLYYYHIDDEIRGGELELSGVFETVNSKKVSNGTAIVTKKIEVEEGMGIVFSNKLYHKVCKITKAKDNISVNDTVGCHRKVISFFLVDPTIKNIIDARSILINSKYNGIQLVKQWIGTNDNDEMSMNWLYDIIGEYLEGDKGYILYMTNKFRYCRKAWASKNHSHRKSSLEEQYSEEYSWSDSD